MSQGPGDRPAFSSAEEPLEAELVETTPAMPPNRFGNQPAYAQPPQQPPRRSKLPMVGCGLAVFTVLLAICGGSVALIYRSSAKILSGAGSSESLPDERPLSEERASIIANLDGTWQVKPKDAKYRGVWRLLRNLEKAKTEDDKATFAKLVDWPAHMVRYYPAYRFQPLNYANRAQLESLERGEFAMPLEANDFKIAAVDERSADDWYVYAYAQEGNLANAAYLFHVRRQNDAWKLVDWAEVAELRWAAATNAAGAGPLVGDPARQEQIAFVSELEQSDKARERGDQAAAEALLRKAESRRGVPQHQDANYYYVAARWHFMNKSDETERVLQRIGKPDAYPWAHGLQAQVHFSRDQYAEALEAIDRYERNAGFYYDLAVIKTHCQAALEQQEKAAKSALALVRYAPDNYEALSLALEHVSPEQLSEVFSLLPAGKETAERLMQAARSALYRDAVDRHKPIRDYLAENYPSGEYALTLDGQLLHYQGELEQALAIQKQLLEREWDKDERRLALGEYVTLLLELKTPMEAYQEATNPRDLLDVMTEGISYGEAQISSAQLRSILPLHREREPEDPKLAWYEAQVAVDQQEWQAAVDAINQAIASLGEGEEQQLLKDELQEQLVEARFQLGQALDVYREAEDPVETYRSLASSMEQNNQWDELKELNRLHPGGPHDLWRRYYGLRVQEYEATESKDARQIITVIAGYMALAEANKVTPTLYAGMLDTRIESLAIAKTDWRIFLRQHAQPASLFYHLSQRFKREHDDAALAELLAIARERFPDEEVVHQFQVEQLWERKDYAGIVAYCAAHPVDHSAVRNYAVIHDRQELLLLSHLMLGDTASAGTVASQPTANVRYQWLVHLAEGNAAAARDFLTEHRNEFYSPMSLSGAALSVPAIKKFLGGEEFRTLRKDLPLPLDGDYFSTRAILLFADASTWSEDSIRERLSAAGLANAEVQHLKRPPLKTNTFRLRLAFGECLLTIYDRPFSTAEVLAKSGQKLEPAWQEALTKHPHWIMLEASRGFDHDGDADWLKVVGALAANVAALNIHLPSGETKQAILAADATQRLATDPSALPALLKSAESYWLPQADDDDEDNEWEPRPWYSRCRAIAQGAKPGRVLVRVHFGNATEEHWLDVVSVKHERWGRYAIDARLRESSQLDPLSSQGDLIRVAPYEIRAWEEE